jgi:hypothetical protein
MRGRALLLGLPRSLVCETCGAKLPRGFASIAGVFAALRLKPLVQLSASPACRTRRVGGEMGGRGKAESDETPSAEGKRGAERDTSFLRSSLPALSQLPQQRTSHFAERKQDEADAGAVGGEFFARFVAKSTLPAWAVCVLCPVCQS